MKQLKIPEKISENTAISLINNNKERVSEDGTGSRSPSKDVGDVGVPPHLNFLD